MDPKKEQKPLKASLATHPVVAQELEPALDYYQDYEYPKISIVVPTYNCAQIISVTLDSALSQFYPDFEVIIVDGGSTDRTVEVVKSYRDERIKIYSVSGNHRYEMLNKGISQSTGQYINFLFPGDFYIYRFTLKHVMSSALHYQKPHLVYCGTLLRDGKSEVKILFRNLSLKLLKNGQQPTSLQSCWFREDVFKKIGKFNTEYSLRGGFELLCRFMLDSSLVVYPTKRILTDYDLRVVTREMILSHFFETIFTLWKYFGLWSVIRWLLIQKDISRFMKHWRSSLKVAFLGRRSN